MMLSMAWWAASCRKTSELQGSHMQLGSVIEMLPTLENLKLISNVLLWSAVRTNHALVLQTLHRDDLVAV